MICVYYVSSGNEFKKKINTESAMYVLIPRGNWLRLLISSTKICQSGLEK